jgi:phosphatidylinositol alpha-mannosyltransferase
MAAAFFARSESWYTAIREALPGERISRSVVTRTLLIGMAGSSVAPGRLGEAARAWLIARRAGRLRDALATVIGTLLSQTLLNLLALVILSVVALAGSAIPGARTESIILTALVPAICVAALIGGPALLARSRTPHDGRLGRIAEWIHSQLVDVRQGLAVFRRPGPAFHSGGFQLLAWGLQWGAGYAALLAFGLQQRAGIAAAAAVLVAVNITAILPVTPSSVGVFQAACIAVLAPFGIHAGEGLAYGLVLQAVEIGCALAMGLPSLLVEGVSIAELRAHAGTPRRAPARRRPGVGGERGAGNRV